MRRDVIAIGASAGGVHALREVASGLPADLPAAVLVTLHVSAHSRSILPQILEWAGALPAEHARDGHPLRPGHIYVAPPDRHLLVVDGAIALSRGARENGTRPALDPMFRSVARAYGPRVIGVVLSGTLDDGAAGLAVVKSRGGTTIAQSPGSAAFPEMPRNAIETGAVDHVLPLDQIAPMLARLVAVPESVPAEDLTRPASAPRRAESEVPPSEGTLVPDSGHASNPPNAYSCPDCGGVLHLVEEPGGAAHFRCRVGHAWGSQSLLAAQLRHVEESLWAALRALEEHRELTMRMLADARGRGSRLTKRYEDGLRDIELNAERIRSVLLHPLPEGDIELEKQ